MNRLVGVVLAQVAEDRGEAYRLLSLNDTPGAISYEVDGRPYSGTGFGTRKLQMAARALILARQSRIAYFGHPNFVPLGPLMRAINPRLRYWVGTHGFEVWQPLKFHARWALRGAEGVTAPSRFTLEHLIETQGLDPRRVTLVPHGLDPGLVNPTFEEPRASSASESGLILTVGRMLAIEPGKGIDTVVRALPKVIQAAPHAHLVVVGDGDRRPALERLVDELGARPKVLFTGQVDEHALRDYYRKAEVFVLPSRQEGFGLVFLEAMAYGKPVIGGDAGGTPDIVVEGQTGYLVKLGDVDSLADRLTRLLNDADLRRRMGAAGKRRLEENYTFDRFKRRLRGLLEGAQPTSR